MNEFNIFGALKEVNEDNIKIELPREIRLDDNKSHDLLTVYLSRTLRESYPIDSTIFAKGKIVNYKGLTTLYATKVIKVK